MPTNGGFGAIWSSIQHGLSKGDTVRNWSAAKNFTGGAFQIEEIEPSAITVSSQGTTTPRRVTRSEFEKVFEVWEDYRHGRLKRNELIHRSRNSTYIISLLYWQGSLAAV